MYISEEKIEQIRNATDIVDTISEYVNLKKRGNSFVGLCPFHQEKTPSFHVNREKQIFHCFGCHAGGNVFKFLMNYKNISFVEAIQESADKAGIAITKSENDGREGQNEQELLYDLNTFAAKYFSNNLLKMSDGETARNYFESRKIKLQTQRIFGLGYSLPAWDHLLNTLKENNIDLTLAKKLGLIDVNQKGEYFDKFRSRVIFPIFSPNGRVIAFGGRILETSDKMPKYLNSPESIIYSKRRSLYGLYHSKEEIRKLDKAILVEGYMDLISLFQGGIKNVVASSGTALTEDQVQLLSRYTKNIIVIFDADTAGRNASMRSIEILLKFDFDIKIADLPEKEDPDSYIKNHGREAFEGLIASSNNFFEYQTGEFKRKGELDDPGLQANSIREIIKNIALVNDELKRVLALKNISKKFNLREKLLESELDKLLKLQNKTTQKNPGQQSFTNNEVRTDPSVLKNINSKSIKLEKEILQLLLEGKKEIIGYIFNYVIPGDFQELSYQKIASIIYDEFMHDKPITVNSIIEKIEDEKLQSVIFSLTFSDDGISKQWENYGFKPDKDSIAGQITKDLIKKFQKLKIDEEINKNTLQINNTNNQEEQLRLLKINNNLSLKKKELDKI